jgi:hypothetical protein
VSEQDWQAIIKQLKMSGVPQGKAGGIPQGGVSPESQAAGSLLQQLGIEEDELSKERIITLINLLTAGLGSEQRRQLGGLIEEAARQLGGKQLPADVAAFLKQLQGD